ncbi:MAG: hypothetical protein RLP45_18290, partial [Haliea sp.]
MQIKRYMAADMRQALKQVRDEQGPDAVILSSRQLPDGLEVVAAVDYDEHLIHDTLERTRTPATPAPARPAGDETSLATMRDEINALRRMLEGQLSSLAWHDFSRQSPVRA